MELAEEHRTVHTEDSIGVVATAQALTLIRRLRTNWWIVLGAIVMGIVGGYIMYSKKVPNYVAAVSFMVNEDEGGRSELVGILGNFGLGGIGGGGGGSYNIPKILEIAKSNKITHPVLLDSVALGGKSDLLVNHLLREIEADKLWENPNYQAPFALQSANLINNEKARWVLQNTNKILIGTKETTGIIRTEADDVTNIMTLYAESTDEELTLMILERLYEELSTYYVDRAIEPQINAFEKISKKTDSLGFVLTAREAQLAQVQDERLGIIRRQDGLRKQRLEREVAMLRLAYGKAVENYELASYNMDTDKPVFQIINQATLPLERQTHSLPAHVIAGAIWGGFLSSLGILVAGIFREWYAIARQRSIQATK